MGVAGPDGPGLAEYRRAQDECGDELAAVGLAGEPEGDGSLY